MKAQEYFKKEYGENHIIYVVKLNDMSSLYSLIDECVQYQNKELIEYIKETKKDKPLSAYGEGYADAINDVGAILNNKTKSK